MKFLENYMMWYKGNEANTCNETSRFHFSIKTYVLAYTWPTKHKVASNKQIEWCLFLKILRKVAKLPIFSYFYLYWFNLVCFLSQVHTNGYITFGIPSSDHSPTQFPEEHTFFVAPYWADTDIANSTIAIVSYEVHQTRTGNEPSIRLNEVSQFVRDQQNISFVGDWMLVAEWNQVPPFGSGLNVSFFVYSTFNKTCNVVVQSEKCKAKSVQHCKSGKLQSTLLDLCAN